MWLFRAFIAAAWVAFILVFADAVDPAFDIRTPLLNVLGVIVIVGMAATVVELHRK